MAKLAIATVTYRFYVRIEDDDMPTSRTSNDDPDADTMYKLLDRIFVEAVETDKSFPISKVIWEWHGDRIDSAFIDTIAYGDNPDELTVRQVAENHRGYNLEAHKDNVIP